MKCFNKSVFEMKKIRKKCVKQDVSLRRIRTLQFNCLYILPLHTSVHNILISSVSLVIKSLTISKGSPCNKQFTQSFTLFGILSTVGFLLQLHLITSFLFLATTHLAFSTSLSSSETITAPSMIFFLRNALFKIQEVF